jgi:hypothetical protein
MEERELTALLQQLGDRVTPGPAPVRRIVAAGEALHGRRSGRVKVFVVAAAAAAVVGGGSVAAVVLDLPSGGGDAGSAAGEAADVAGGAGGGEDAGAQAESGGGSEGSVSDEEAGVADVDAVLVVTPDVAQPGDTVELTAPDEDATFGLAWRLERSTAGGWSWEYSLVAASGAGEPTWAPAEEELTLPQPAIPDPVRLVVPQGTAPGEYRICQDDGTADRCGLLTVTG